MQDFKGNGGEIWGEKMVIYRSEVERKDWKTMQGAMAQSS